MNSTLILIICLLVGVFSLETLADLLNLGRLKGSIPKEFEGFYDSKKYALYLSYQRVNAYSDLVKSTISLTVTLLFILLGGFNILDQFARSFNFNSIGTGLVFIGVLSFLRFLLQLPFSIFDTFVIEEKYGFNRTNLKTFISDLAKSAILGSIFGAIIFSGILFFFEATGPSGWLYAWIAFTLFQLLLMYLAPAIIMPLFNKFSPLEEGPLKEAIQEYAKTRNFQLSGIYTMDSSKRSSKANAFFTGFGNFRRLVLFDTLISKHTQSELLAILAHEVGHFEKKHIIKSLILSIFSTGVIFFTFKLFLNNPSLFDAFKMENTSVYASIVFVGFLYSPIFRILSLFTQGLSRKYEFEADEFAVDTYGQPETLISALKKLSVDHLSHLNPHPLKVLLDYSHPPLLKRIQAMRNRAK